MYLDVYFLRWKGGGVWRGGGGGVDKETNKVYMCVGIDMCACVHGVYVCMHVCEGMCMCMRVCACI